LDKKQNEQLAARLAAMDGNERRKLLKRASKMRKDLMAKGGASRARAGAELDEDGILLPMAPRRAPTVDECLWRILSEEAAMESTSVAEAGQKGTVIGVSRARCEIVLGGDGRRVRALPTPEMIREQQTVLAVGDEVLAEEFEGAWRVLRVLPRRTRLSRPDPGSPIERVVVANVDLVVVVVSVVAPPLHPRLIDRYLIAIGRGGAKAALCVNKLDLLAEDADEELAKLRPYEELGVPIVRCSAAAGDGLAELHELLRGKTCAFVGHSGVGKSSLLNALRPSLELDTGDVSAAYGRGQHTTTASHLWDLGEGTRVIDTPGVRSFGLWSLTRKELPWYFPEFEGRECRFRDCTHTVEPGCGVRAAVEAGEIMKERYETYLRILETL
jgi:ribosome biogenesis GTPase / thiamine phosphate phosphatase